MRRLTCGVFLVALAAGGSGCGRSDDGSVSVTFYPSPLERTLLQAESRRTVTANAHVVPVPGDVVSIRLVDTGTALVPGAATVRDHGKGAYSASLPVKDGLAIGEYRGTLSLELCKDADCASKHPITGGTLPYTITIVDHVTTTATATLTVGGIVQNGMGGEVDAQGARNYAVTVPSGQVLGIELAGAQFDEYRFTQTGTAPGYVPLTSTSPSRTEWRFSLSVPSDASESVTMHVRTTDAQAFNIHVTVTRAP